MKSFDPSASDVLLLVASLAFALFTNLISHDVEHGDDLRLILARNSSYSRIQRHDNALGFRSIEAGDLRQYPSAPVRGSSGNFNLATGRTSTANSELIGDNPWDDSSFDFEESGIDDDPVEAGLDEDSEEADFDDDSEEADLDEDSEEADLDYLSQLQASINYDEAGFENPLDFQDSLSDSEEAGLVEDSEEAGLVGDSEEPPELDWDERVPQQRARVVRYDIDDLPPAFENEEDYPPGWLVYHPVHGVITRERLLELERGESVTHTDIHSGNDDDSLPDSEEAGDVTRSSEDAAPPSESPMPQGKSTGQYNRTSSIPINILLTTLSSIDAVRTVSSTESSGEDTENEHTCASDDLFQLEEVSTDPLPPPTELIPSGAVSLRGTCACQCVDEEVKALMTPLPPGAKAYKRDRRARSTPSPRLTDNKKGVPPNFGGMIISPWQSTNNNCPVGGSLCN